MAALLPLVPALSVVGGSLSESGLQRVGFDDLGCFHLWSAVLWTVGTIVVWRAVIVWTFGRRFLTAVVAVVPFAQVLYPHPLWQAGCGSDDVLRAGQHFTDAGLWVWLTIWVWWGWERRCMRDELVGIRNMARMSSVARRIMASIGLIPFVVGFFGITAVALESFVGLQMNTGREFALVYAIASLPAVGLWFGIWRGAVAWSPKAIRDAVASTALLIGLPIITLAIRNTPSTTLEECLYWLPVVGWGVWMVSAGWVWPMRGEVSADGTITPRCGRCGYLLTGLRATRCPECGDEPTIDELWRATAGEIV